MTPQQHILGFVDSGREIRRPPVIGMQFLHEGSMRSDHFLLWRALLKSQYLISLIFRHRDRSGARPSAPRVTLVLRCSTPAGKPAVEIGFHQPRPFGIIPAAEMIESFALRPRQNV